MRRVEGEGSRKYKHRPLLDEILLGIQTLHGKGRGGREDGVKKNANWKKRGESYAKKCLRYSTHRGR